ncbi:MAG: hypothetical protein HYS15_03650 [Candidatus Spechtbacteria bacterium]|nr:hypothetical protein [Candidatus Spechtbacteria bacterium]
MKKIFSLRTISHSAVIFREKGIAIVLALLVLSSVLAIALGISTILLKEVQFGKSAGFYIPALFAADSGIEKILIVRNDPNQFTGCKTRADALTRDDCKLSNGALFWVKIRAKATDPTCQAENFCVESTGEYQGTRRAIEANY